MIYLNGKLVTPTRFPDNTTQVWKLFQDDAPPRSATVRWDFRHEGEFMELAQLKTLLDSLSITATLLLDYLPYGRQDKPVRDGATFALTTFAALLNTLNFAQVRLLDPHSDEALKLIRRSWALYPEQQVRAAFAETGSTIICYPDEGARNRYAKRYVLPFLCGSKVRNQSTGRIESYTFPNWGVVGDTVLIVDDICDGGATFVLLAEKLYASGAKEVNLFVTHGIFSKGLRPLHDAGIRRVFTAKGEPRTLPDGALSYPERNAT